MKNKIIKFIFFAGILISLATVPAFSQQPIPIGPGDGDNNTTPIGGLAMLAVLGGGYAVKKLAGRNLGEGGLHDGRRQS